MSAPALPKISLTQWIAGHTKTVTLTLSGSGSIAGWTFTVVLYDVNGDRATITLTNGAGTEIVDAAARQWRFTIVGALTSGWATTTLGLQMAYTVGGVTYSLGTGDATVLANKAAA